MPEYMHLTKGIRKQQLQAFLRINRAQSSFDTQPAYRAKHLEMKREQFSHGFGITRYNKKRKHKDNK